MRIVWSLVLVVVVTFSSAVRAERVPPLAVDRGPGAERCPDAETIGARIDQIRGRPATGLPHPYRVAFARTDDGFSATIRTEATAGSVRTLQHYGVNCSALTNAVALTLALLFDSDIEPKKKETPPPPLPAAPAAATTTAPSPPSLPPSREATAALGALGLFGVLRPAVPAFSADIGVRFAPLRLSAGALWVWPQTLSFGPGTVHERLLAGFARVCVPAWQGGGFRLDACSGAFAGAVTAEGEGYTSNLRRTRAWIAVPLEAAIAGWSAPVGWELSLGALLPLLRPDFTIDGVGTVYGSPPVGALVSLRMMGIVPF